MATQRGSFGWALLAERQAQSAAHYFAVAQGMLDPTDREACLRQGRRAMALATDYARKGEEQAKIEARRAAKLEISK